MDVGTVVEQYKIVEHIGRGGMADVWSARDTTLGRMVAIKTIARNLSTSSDPVAMFEQEAKTIASLEHPHILPIYGFGEVSGKLYIVMRFVTGGSLEDQMRRGQLPFSEVVRIGSAIAAALNHAHLENVVHLDLKPPNILMDGAGSPYLADFGLATVMDTAGRANNPGSGTLLYMPPEQFIEDSLDYHADVYSFGLMLFHMIAGELPFSASSPLALRQIQFQENIPPLSNYRDNTPAELDSILQRATDPSPDARYDSLLEMMEDTRAACGMSQALEITTLRTASAPTPETTPFVNLASALNPQNAERNEARMIYEQALQAWTNGRGAFLLSVTHYMVMSDHYREAAQHNLSYDDNGAALLLRGALEYNYDLDYWWDHVGDDDRRWVCLHTIRSENPQARIRALHRLQILPDASPPVIPTKVTAALSLENDEAVILAGLHVLGVRATHDTWEPVAYSIEIDRVIAEMAVDEASPKMANAAARVIGQVRSTYAAQVLRNIAPASVALRALAYVVDEAHSLPADTPPRWRLLAWGRNTWRRLTENQLQIGWSVTIALLFGWIAMAVNIYAVFLGRQVLLQALIANMLGMGAFFGVATASLALLAKILPERLRGFWSKWMQLLLSGAAAFFIGPFVWWTYTWLYLQLPGVPNDIMILVGIGSVLAITPTVMFKLRGWQALLLTFSGTLIPLLIGSINQYNVFFGSGEPLLRLSGESYILFYDKLWHLWSVLPLMVLLYALGFHMQAIVADLREWRGMRVAPTSPAPAAQSPLKTVPVAPPTTSSPQSDQPAQKRFETIPIVDPGDEALTEEFELDRVGGRQPSLSEQPDLHTTVANDAGGSMTEEFELDRVGGRQPSLSEQPDLHTTVADDAGGSMTEEFELDRVGGRQKPDNHETDVLNEIQRQLKEWDQEDGDDST